MRTVRVPGERVSLVPFEEAHITDRYVGWLNDPQVVQFSENRHRLHSIESCRAYFLSMKNGQHCFWAIHENALNDPLQSHIGNVTAYLDRNNGSADLAIILGERPAWGRGLGREAWTLALDWLLTEGGLRKVTAGTMAANVRMLKAMKAAGMTEEGQRKDQFLLDGQPVDLVLTAKFSSNRSGASK